MSSVGKVAKYNPAGIKSELDKKFTYMGEFRQLYQTGKEWYNLYQAKKQYTVRVAETDDVYHSTIEWALGLSQSPKTRVLNAKTVVTPVRSKKYEYDRSSVQSENSEFVPSSLRGLPAVASDEPVRKSIEDNCTDRYTSALVVQPYSESTQVFYLQGQKIKFALERPDRTNTYGEDRAPAYLVFYCPSKRAQEALTGELKRLLAAQNKPVKSDGKPLRKYSRMLTATKFGDWSRGDGAGVLVRPKESVVLSPGQMERILSDLGKFLSEEDFYIDRGLPYHRGYLFTGPPGTGKSSIAKVIAGEFGMPLYYLPLGDIKDDTEIVNLLIQVPQRSVLLLEDVDVFAAAQSRTHEDGTHSLSLSGLLNALDGIATPHGLVTIMTTNDPDKLDPALTRSGRMDMIEVLGLPTDDMTSLLFEWFYREKPASHLYANGRSSADLSEIFKQHMRDPMAAQEILSKESSS